MVWVRAISRQCREGDGTGEGCLEMVGSRQCWAGDGERWQGQGRG